MINFSISFILWSLTRFKSAFLGRNLLISPIGTNIIESYERLMAFIAKHFPAKFTIIKGQRVNLRDHLFRGFIGDLLVHGEYTNPFPAKLITEGNQVRTENWINPTVAER